MEQAPHLVGVGGTQRDEGRQGVPPAGAGTVHLAHLGEGATEDREHLRAVELAPRSRSAFSDCSASEAD